jgi:hypothetical protein
MERDAGADYGADATRQPLDEHGLRSRIDVLAPRRSRASKRDRPRSTPLRAPLVSPSVGAPSRFLDPPRACR